MVHWVFKTHSLNASFNEGHNGMGASYQLSGQPCPFIQFTGEFKKKITQKNPQKTPIEKKTLALTKTDLLATTNNTTGNPEGAQGTQSQGQGGNDNLSNTQDLHLYLGKVRSKIKPWIDEASDQAFSQTTPANVSVTAAAEIKAKYILSIAKDGQLKDIKIHTSSGNQSVDQLFIRRIQKAAPFETVPDSILPFHQNLLQFILPIFLDHKTRS
jgi:outer membrane biosynthesis protein TonB